MKKFLLALAAMLALTSTASAASKASEPRLTLSQSNLLTLRDEVSDETVSPIILQLMLMKSNDVVLYISSPGGSIIAGNRLIQAMKASGKNITCVAEFAASMAFSIFQTCNVRYVLPGAIIMQHQASYGAEGSLSEMRTQMEFAEKLAYKLNSDDAGRLGMPVKDFQARIHDEWWMFDAEAVSYHAADATVLAKCSADLAGKKEVQVIDSLFGSATLVWSGCPLVSYPLSVKIERKKDVDARDYNEWAKGVYMDRDWKTRRAVKVEL